MLNGDQAFKKTYQKIKSLRIEQFNHYLDLMEKSGLLQNPMAAKERDALIFILWTYAEGIVTALHTSGLPIDLATIQARLKDSIYLFRPYLVPRIWETLEKHCVQSRLDNLE